MRSQKPPWTRAANAALLAALALFPFFLAPSGEARDGGAAYTMSALTPPLASQRRDGGELLAALSASTCGTSANFAANRMETPLAAGASYRANRAVASLSFGLSDTLTAFANASYVDSMVRSGMLEISEPSPGDADAGLRLSPDLGAWRLTFEAGTLQPMYARAESAEWSRLTARSSIPPGNGIREYWGAFALEAPLWEGVRLGAGTGASYRATGFMNPYLAAGYLRYERPRRFFAKAGVVRQGVLSGDAFGDAHGPVMDRSHAVIAGSEALNAIDPALTRLEASAGVYATHRLFFSGEFRAELAGRNAPKGLFFLAAAGFHLGGVPPSPFAGKESEADRHGRSGFRQYHFSANVIQVNRQLGQFLVDRGAQDGVEPGETLDVFRPDPTGQTLGETIARAKVLEAGPTRAKLEITERFQGADGIKEGFVVRRPLH